MLPGPLTRISPSSAILISTPGNGLPTVRNLCSCNVLEHTPDDVSVMPHPFRIGTPMAQKNSSTSRDSAAPPLMKNRSLPPVRRLRNPESTSLSATPYFIRSNGPGDVEWECSLPVSIDQRKSD